MFTEACREGDMNYVRKCLICGADPNSVDHTGCRWELTREHDRQAALPAVSPPSA